MADYPPFIPDDNHRGTDPRLAGGRLTIDLDALIANYRLLQEKALPARVAGVVKANAYGLGLEPVARALLAAGCDTFFVAMPAEGVALRRVAPDAHIFILSGPMGIDAPAVFAENRLLPVINSPLDLSIWEAYGWDDDAVSRPCALHVDTGMNRLGLTPEEAASFARDNELTGAITPLIVMSHLACGDTTGHLLNRQQLEAFQAVSQHFPQSQKSLANSGGTFLGTDFAFDLVRPGIAVYGGNAQDVTANPMQPVVTAEARIIQLRQAAAGETISYGAAETLKRDTIIAIAAVGYADGYHRAGSGAGVPVRDVVKPGAHGFLHGHRVPVMGRVTMDLTMFDVTDLGVHGVATGDHIELFGPNIALDEAAGTAGTISYELLTSLGRRYYRHYVGGQA